MTDCRWPARLALTATRPGEVTRVHARHEGPLRSLKTLYPEGPAVAHAVLVHPPGGLVGGDRLDVAIDVQNGAHLLVTTPAATRFYRSSAGEAAQVVTAQVAERARLEWVPQETLAYSGCEARNVVKLSLAAGASLMASEVLGLGLPAAGQGFERGRLLQHLEVVGQWIDRGWIDASDAALMSGPCGMAGHSVLATLVYAQPETLALDALLDASRAALPPGLTAGVTSLQGRVLLARVLADEVEAAQAALRVLRALWRERLWGLPACEPRVWAT